MEITSYCIKNFDKIKHFDNYNKIFAVQGKYAQRAENKFIDSFALVRELIIMKDTYLNPLTEEQRIKSLDVFHERTNDLMTFENNECFKPVNIYEHKNKFDNIIFFDVQYSDIDGSITETVINTCDIKGIKKQYIYDDCNGEPARTFLRSLMSNSLLYTNDKTNAIILIKYLCGSITDISNGYFIRYNGYVKNFKMEYVEVSILNFNNFIDVDFKNYPETFNIEINENKTVMMSQAFNIFRKNINDHFKLDVSNYITLNSLLKSYLYNNGVFSNVYQLGGCIKLFIDKCTYGARVGTRNDKYNEADNLQCIDANSLYTTAMNLMNGFIKGTPKALTNENLTFDFVNKQTYYFVKIHVTKVNKHITYPLYFERVNDELKYTNDFIDKHIYVDKLTLEDYIKYHEIEFEILQGYYFDDGFNNKIVEINNYLLEKRNEYKGKNKCLEMIYKKLLNSVYGITLTKSSESNIKIVKGVENIEAFTSRNFDYILSCDIYENGTLARFKLIKQLNKHFNLSHIGSSILSGARKIMNNIYNTAENNNLPIYYTDTDSVFMNVNDIKQLETIYKNETGNDLIGSNLGQFKYELPEVATCIFAAKKKYCAVSNNNVRIRCAGISSDTLIKYCDENNLSVLDLYRSTNGINKINIKHANKEYYSNGYSVIKKEFNFNF
jgi:hypothetical protein